MEVALYGDLRLWAAFNPDGCGILLFPLTPAAVQQTENYISFPEIYNHRSLFYPTGQLGCPGPVNDPELSDIALKVGAVCQGLWRLSLWPRYGS